MDEFVGIAGTQAKSQEALEWKGIKWVVENSGACMEYGWWNGENKKEDIEKAKMR